MFRVPDSSPPSTPNTHHSSRTAPPSTTPAGPPPDLRSFIPSSTPAGPPPTNSLFGNSHFNTQKPLSFGNSFGVTNTGSFGFSRNLNSSPPKNEFSGVGSGQFGVPTSARPGSQRGRTSYRLPSSPLQDDEEEEDVDAEGESEEDEEDEDMEEDEDDDEDMDEEEDDDDELDDTFAQGRSRGNNKLSHSVASRGSLAEHSNPILVPFSAKQTHHDLLSLAKGLIPTIDRVTTHREPSGLILETESLLEKLHESMINDTPEKRTIVLEEVAQELLATWKSTPQTSFRGSLSASGRAGISPLAQAHRLSSLLLNIHHPGRVAEKLRGSTFSLVPTRPESRHFIPIPKTLIDWLDSYHDPGNEIPYVLRETGGYSASAHYWDAVLASTMRGKFHTVMKLLQGANFSVAETSEHDGLGSGGYQGRHLQEAQRAIRAALDLLEGCPAIASNDYDIKGHDWDIFRQQTYNALRYLREEAEGDRQDNYDASQSFQASHFGISQSQNSFALSQASRRAESKVPWSIYENLLRLYNLLLGSEEEIIALASDWVEATIGLSIWWDGEEEDVSKGSLAASRRSLARSQRVRTADVTPVKAYCQRISAALATVLDSEEDDLSINTTDRYEVGLACIFDDNIEGILQILRGWSLPIASAVAEVASSGDWFRRADGILDQFDQSDLMVLSYNEEQRPSVSKDDLLIAYSDFLSSQEHLASKDGNVVKEGWEVAVQVLGRLDDHLNANERIQTILNELSLESSDRVDKITQLCYGMNLSEHARSIALKYADHLRSNTQNYGDTLLYYARAHSATRIQEVLRVLVAHCLVKSIAYPTVDEIDPSLATLITSPKQTLTKFASTDPEGAQLLSNYLSGYATIRKFYEVRDEEALIKTGEKPAHRPLARKRIAASALLVIISSAASSIRGGLYDPEIETVVQVDVLLCLLGEALVFLNQPKRTLTLRHLYSLLAAVEDLDTAPSMIRAQCEEVLTTTLAAAHGDAPKIPSPTAMLQKSTSNLTTASSQYSLIGSTEFGSVGDRSTESSAVLVRGSGPEREKDTFKRGWDWRKGFEKDASGVEVIRVLRLAIARELAAAFADGEV
ncbi:hypothetical protein B0J11DRAFT_18939 [Dendryphion nanum]|uniref:Nuclear pore complex protein Nup85 n=1 Tax=Dendryphion nanum TaxID=256645 RepID=A0A9P9EIM8_9PLEO|nr:hypothetical protein B0J11DRAFT_18939 [Dendryphion nanum]